MNDINTIPEYVDFPTHFPLLLRHALIGGGIDCGEGWRALLFTLFTQLEAQAERGIDENQFEIVARPQLAPDDGGEHGRLAWLYRKAAWVHVPYTHQIKQKLSGLVVSMQSETEAMRALIFAAQALAANTCEVCGEPGKSLLVKRWYSVRCPAHATSTQAPG